MFFQTATFAWWASSVETRVTETAARVAAMTPQADRLTKVEVKLDGVQDRLVEIRDIVRSNGPSAYTLAQPLRPKPGR